MADPTAAELREVAGVRCDAVLALLPDVVDGTAAPADVARVQAHLAGCDVCERFGGAYARLVSLARATPPPGDPAADATLDALLGRLDAALDAAPSPDE